MHHQSNFDGAHSEHGRDPNVIFGELGKGVISEKIGEKCAAIVRYPQLFEAYPFPIMIKSSFLRLAHVFRSDTETNFIRLCIFQVTQQCAQHLEKIENVDEIVHRIHSVIHCNDPIKRALTLKMLGSMSCIIAEQRFVHHSILSSLDSHDRVEVVAALYAASLFARRSKNFASSVCTKLTEMIEQNSVPVDMKLEFISVLRNMNCNSETFEKARKLCLTVLEKYPSNKFVLSVLHTLTLMSKRCLIYLNEQVELLLRYLNEDARMSVKKVALKDLKLLAGCAPHVWNNNYVHAILEFMKETSSNDLKLLSLKVLSQLSYTVAVYLLAKHLDSPQSAILECCQATCHDEDLLMSLEGFQMYVNVVTYEINLLSGAFIKDDEEKPAILEDLCSVVEMKIALLVDDESNESLQVLKKCLVSTVTLCQACPSVAVQLADHVIFLLGDCGNVEKSISLCEFLSAIHSKLNGMKSFENSLKFLLKKVSQANNTFVSRDGNFRETLLLSIIRLLLQSRHSLNKSINKEGDDCEDLYLVVFNCLEKANAWTSYRAARQAARYGSHELAAAIFLDINKKCCNESHCFWLNGLTNYCRGQKELERIEFGADMRSEQIKVLHQADMLFGDAITAFKAAVTSQNLFTFQTEYTQLRSKMLRCLMQMVQACCSYQTVPPPAIASSLAITTGQERHKCQHVLNQLQNCRSKLSELEQAYHSLYYSCFDADTQSLDHISLFIDICKLLLHILDSILNLAKSPDLRLPVPKFDELLNFDDTNCTTEQKHWKNAKKKILSRLEECLGCISSTPLTPEVVSFIEDVTILCSKFPYCLPRFFFQKLQTTDVKLVVSPSMKGPDEPVLVRCESDVVVSVEGIISINKKKNVSSQTPNRVQLQICSELASKQTAVPKVSNNFVEACPIQGDYFRHMFLLSFPSPGIHQTCIEAKILDSSDKLWSTTAKSFLIFQAYDEALYRQQQLQQINS